MNNPEKVLSIAPEIPGIEVLLPMFDTFENTLDAIEVKGRENHDRMLGCMSAIDQMRSIVLANIEKSNKEGVEVKDGRPGDIGTDSGNGRKR